MDQSDSTAAATAAEPGRRGADAEAAAAPASPAGAAEAVALLHAEGYGDGIEVTADGIWCTACADVHTTEGVVQERVFRFEGPSNPDDMSIVVGLRCGKCGRTGIVVSAYGPLADPRLFDILNRMPIDSDAHDPAADG